jgi:hypothetical protein
MTRFDGRCHDDETTLVLILGSISPENRNNGLPRLFASEDSERFDTAAGIKSASPERRIQQSQLWIG